MSSGLTDTALRNLKPQAALFKKVDRDGLYVAVTPSGIKSFRFDYRINGRRETLVLGRYDPTLGAQVPRTLQDLKYGISVSLAEARLLLAQARREVELGNSPADAKKSIKLKLAATLTFGAWADRFFEEADLADSTRAMRRSIYERDLRAAFGRRKLEEIEPTMLSDLCDKIKKERDAPATALHVREITQQIYRFAQGKGVKVDNPADGVRAKDIAKFKPRERKLSPAEIRQFFTALDSVGTMPQLRLGLKFILLTLLRKGELLNARWEWVDFEAGTLTVPAEWMKARKVHVVYLSQQAQDILIALQAMAGSSPYLLPGRYETDQPMSNATLNRVITATLEKMNKEGAEMEPFTVHDLRRTGSTLLHEAEFNSDWIEKCLAHEQGGVRATYNKAEYTEQRREMLQVWADMLDAWLKGSTASPLQFARAATALTQVNAARRAE
jgi:integrase